MTLLTKESEIIEFINTKKLDIYSLNDVRKIYIYYIQCITTAFQSSYTRLNDKYLAKISINMVDTIFWTIYYFTFNIKLTMFLCERSILLYTEYIYFSKNNNISENLFDNEDIDIKEASKFVITKTIGPLDIINIKVKKSKKYANRLNVINTIQNNCFLIKEINNFIIDNLKNENDLLVKYDEYNNYMKINIMPIIKLNKDNIIFDNALHKINTNDINIFIHIVRIYYSVLNLNRLANLNEIVLSLTDEDKELLSKKYEKGVIDCPVYNKIIKYYK